MLKNYIGKSYEDVNELSEDFMCEFPGIVYFGDVQNVPYSSSKRMEVYNEPSEFDDEEDFEEESYTVEFITNDDETIEITDIF